MAGGGAQSIWGPPLPLPGAVGTMEGFFVPQFLSHEQDPNASCDGLNVSPPPHPNSCWHPNPQHLRK